MSEMVTLTMEVEVPREQLPPGYTGRLLWRQMNPGEHALADHSEPMFPAWQWQGDCGTPNKYPVIEVRQPWRVPDHLRDKRFNLMLLRHWQFSKTDSGWALYVMSAIGNDELYEYVSSRKTIPTTLGQILGLTVADFEQMDANKCYQLGEGAE